MMIDTKCHNSSNLLGYIRFRKSIRDRMSFSRMDVVVLVLVVTYLVQ